MPDVDPCLLVGGRAPDGVKPAEWSPGHEEGTGHRLGEDIRVQEDAGRATAHRTGRR